MGHIEPSLFPEHLLWAGRPVGQRDCAPHALLAGSAGVTHVHPSEAEGREASGEEERGCKGYRFLQLVGKLGLTKQRSPEGSRQYL